MKLNQRSQKMGILLENWRKMTEKYISAEESKIVVLTYEDKPAKT